MDSVLEVVLISLQVTVFHRFTRPRVLAEVFRISGESLGIKVSERYLPIGVGLDSIPIASRGFETVTLTAGDVSSVALKIHSEQDRSDLLDVESLQQVGVLLVDVLERT